MPFSTPKPENPSPCQLLRELDNQGTVFFLAVTMILIKLDHIVRGGEPYLRTRGIVAARSVTMIRHPRGSYIVMTFAV